MIKRTLFVCLLLVMLLTSACAQPTPAPQTTAAEPEQPPAAEQPTSAPSEAQVRQLTLAHSWNPIKVDPGIGSDFAAESMLVNLYDSLLFPTVDGALESWVAESWEMSDDRLSYTFKLKKGIKFHDGSELLASDVVFSMNRNLAIGQGHAYMFVDRVESATAPDDYTVVFKIKQPYALFPFTLLRLFILNEDEVMAHIEKEGEYGEFGDYGTSWLLTHDAGSGPYKVKDLKLEEYLVMEKNTDYWNKEIFVSNSPDLVRVIPIPDPATLRTLMANRELDISDQWQSADTFRAMDEIEGVDIAMFDAVTMLYMYFNNKMPPMDDVHFRKAVAYAFDYETAANIDWPGTKTSLGPVPAGVAGFNNNLVPYTRDLEKARAELAQSKYADQLSQYPIEFTWNTDVPDQEKYALLFQSNMQEIGVPVNITSVPWLTLTEMATKEDTSPMVWLLYLNADLPEAGALLFQRYHSSTQGTFFQGEWLGDQEFDQRMAEALTIADKDARFAAYAELQQYIMDLCPTVYVFDQFQKHAYQTYLEWPATQGTVYPVMGYNQYFAFIGVKDH